MPNKLIHCMKKVVFTSVLFVVFSITNIFSQEKDHPKFSLGFTDLIQADNWIDDFVVDIRLLKNLDNGFAVGGKAAVGFEEIFEAGVSMRKTLVSTLYVYGDGGYSFSNMDGAFLEAGLGTYFLKSKALGIHLGYKNYFGPNKPFMSAGFSANF